MLRFSEVRRNIRYRDTFIVQLNVTDLDPQRDYSAEMKPIIEKSIELIDLRFPQEGVK